MGRHRRTRWPLMAVKPSAFLMRPSAPDGHAIVIAAGTLAYVWRFEATTAPKILRGHDKSIANATFSPDGTLVLTASDDGTARLWDVVGRRKPRGPSWTHRPRVHRGLLRRRHACAHSVGRRHRAGVEHELRVRLHLILRGHQGYVMSAAFSRDGSRVISTGADRTARIWDISAAGNNVLATFQGNSLRSASVDPGGRLMARHDPHRWHGAPAADRRQRRYTEHSAGTKAR